VPKLLILLLLLAAAVGTVVILWAGQRQQVIRLQRELAVNQERAAQLETRNQELAAQLTHLEGERQHLEDRVTSLRTELTTVTADLSRSRTSLQELQERSRSVEDERTQLQVRVAQALDEREDARGRADRLAQETLDLKRTVGRLRERLALLDRDYRKLVEKFTEAKPTILASNPGVQVIGQYDPTGPAVPPSPSPAPSSVSWRAGSVELPPIVVRKEPGGASTLVRARLVEVNEPHNFVVVDKGSRDGVQAGMVFDILHGTSLVGRARVIRVHPQLSACDILRAQTPGPLQVGDLAVQSGL